MSPYNKYGNKKLDTPDGKFDSKYEYEEWCRLKILEKGKYITELQRQVPFEIVPTITTTAGTLSKIKYIADFVYVENGVLKVVDTKGYETEIYKLKKRLFISRYINGNAVFIERKKGKPDIVYGRIK